MSSESERDAYTARHDRIASDALDAEERAVDCAWQHLDGLQWRLTEFVASGDTWQDAASESVNDFAETIAAMAIDGEAARDDDARDALSDWVRENAADIAATWIAARKVAS